MATFRRAHFFLHHFTGHYYWGPSGNSFPNGFIQKRQEASGEKFRIINKSYYKIRSWVLRELEYLLRDCNGGRELLRYIANGDKNNNHIFVVTNLLEAFQLGTYDISGGKDPEIFIRINDPYKVRVLV